MPLLLPRSKNTSNFRNFIFVFGNDAVTKAKKHIQSAAVDSVYCQLNAIYRCNYLRDSIEQRSRPRARRTIVPIWLPSINYSIKPAPKPWYLPYRSTRYKQWGHLESRSATIAVTRISSVSPTDNLTRSQLSSLRQGPFRARVENSNLSRFAISMTIVTVFGKRNGVTNFISGPFRD